MIRTIEQALYDDPGSVYKKCRHEYQPRIEELEKERAKILRKKKNKKEKRRLLMQNSKAKLRYLALSLNNAVKYYKQIYYENDYYRQKKLLEA